ncbi:hypothetical protein THAOC_00606 [Thalassiosira oceanica]|uniref:MYND-type domain-containing protein n=1 Tax=Thalassiosira oceanica TaxID=159749 RepID=K0TRC5_THAOC|nr:hypothetical protein THAOC_00606 [Thalassiosira oceanica]|eukprot:EJK77557.1 hypothetical protein THAOC_00606 [Thalassiosira oceanica]
MVRGERLEGLGESKPACGTALGPLFCFARLRHEVSKRVSTRTPVDGRRKEKSHDLRKEAGQLVKGPGALRGADPGRHQVSQADSSTNKRWHPQLTTMSCVPVVDDVGVCANCGKQGSDVVKLKDCTACRLVKYCGVDCQRAHRKLHKKACKRRAAEIKDEQLYSQGHERPERDFCPLCTLPIQLPMTKYSIMNVCCMKRICNGCDFAAQKRGMLDCPFCRTPIPDNDADTLAMIQARVAKKDPEAIFYLGLKYFFGHLGLQKDARKGVVLYTEAAELGSVDALFNLGHAYDTGEGVQEDKVKATEFYTKAALQGHVMSRHNLGACENQKGNYDCTVRHLLTSAKMGLKESLESIKEAFLRGQATKAQYAEALKGYQDAVEEMKSHDRDEANPNRRA